MWTTNNFPGQRSGADPGKPSELRGKTIKCGHTVWKMRAGNPTPVLRISANVTGDFGNVTDLRLGAGLRG